MNSPEARALFKANMEDAVRNSPLSGDILYGADGISEFLFGDRKHRRKVYNLVETGQLPVFRLGTNICARKSVLLNWICRQESSAISNAPGQDEASRAIP